MNYYKLNAPDVTAEQFDNEILAVNIITGRYHSIKGSGAVLLRLMLDGNSTEASISKTLNLFSTEAVSTKDFNSFIVELITENLIVECSAPEEVLASDWLSKVDSTTYTAPQVEIHSDMEGLVLLS